LTELAALEVDGLSPLQALQTIHRWKQSLTA